MATSTVSHHVFRRTARKQERRLEHERYLQISYAGLAEDAAAIERLKKTHYRVAQRKGGLRWAVEKVTS